MINYASFLNQFKNSSSNLINQLLEQTNLTLSKIIDEESFLNQCKISNPKLVQFLDYSKVKQLVSYIVEAGPQEDKKRSYKFPQIAAQVLSSDLAYIHDFILPQGQLFEKKITIQEQIVETQVDAEQNQQKQVLLNKQNQQKNIKLKTILENAQKSCDQQSVSKLESQLTQQSEPIQENKEKDKQEHEKQIHLEQSVIQSSQKMKVKVQNIKKIEKISTVPAKPLIHDLIDYFDSEINYILTGYVCKVLASLFQKKQALIMKFLFDQQKILKIVNHIESRSVGEFLNKVLTFQSSKWVNQRAELFIQLIKKLGFNDQVHVISNFSVFILQTIQKAASNIKSSNPVAQFNRIFFSPQVVTIIIKNVISDNQNISIYNAPILLTYLTHVPFNLPQDQLMINQYKKLLEMFIDKSLDKLNITNKQHSKLGFGRIKIIQILTFILKENLLNSREIFSTKELAFSILFNLCKNFEFNNILHNQVVKIVSLAFTDINLSQSLIKNDTILKFLLQEAQEDLKIREKGCPQKSRKGFIGHVVQMCRIIQQQASKDNQSALKILQREEFDRILLILVQKQVSEGNKNLGGFSLKKDLKGEIMFQKQDIITHYIDFLTHSPKPIFEEQAEPINIEHPDFLQQMKRQIQQNFSHQDQYKQVHVIAAIGAQEIEPAQPEIRIEIHFFKNHLDYDLGQLMEHL